MSIRVEKSSPRVLWTS